MDAGRPHSNDNVVCEVCVAATTAPSSGPFSNHRQRLVFPDPEGPRIRNLGILAAAALDLKIRKWRSIGTSAIRSVATIRIGVDGEKIESIVVVFWL